MQSCGGSVSIQNSKFLPKRNLVLYRRVNINHLCIKKYNNNRLLAKKLQQLIQQKIQIYLPKQKLYRGSQ